MEPEEIVLKINESMTDGFNRVYDTLGAHKKELSQEIATVSKCVNEHQEKCALRFGSNESHIAEHKHLLSNIKTRHDDEDKTLTEAVTNKRQTWLHIVRAVAVVSVIGLPSVAYWIITKLLAIIQGLKNVGILE